MFTGRDIIIVGQQPWDAEIGSNCKDIALELSKTNRVLYVNSPLDRISKIRYAHTPYVKRRLDVIKKGQPEIITINNNLFNLYPNCIAESINWIPTTQLFNKANWINNKRFSLSILKAVQELNFKDYLLFNDSEIFKAFYLKELLKPVLSAYYSRDYLMGVKYWQKHGSTLEPALIAKSDLCLANSEYLRKYCEKYNKNSFYVGQGCDFTYFDTNNIGVATEIQSIQKPIVGYVGALWTSRLDLTLLENMAKKKTEWSFVYVGPEDEKFQNSELHQLTNVHFLGPKSPDQLGTYIKGFDVCINPQYLNPITIGNYPRKIDEYLALGKPTVATKTEAMMDFQDYVYLAENEAQFVTGIQYLLETDNTEMQQRRINFALSHSWENCVNKILDAYYTVASKNQQNL